jgi:hypothetical protein
MTAAMKRRALLACAVIGVVALALVLVGFILAGYIPPPKANWTPAHIAQFYGTHTTRKRFGIFLLLFATVGFAPLVAGMTIVLMRIEGSRPALAITQAVSGAVGTAFLFLFAVLLAVAAFRPGRSPDVTQAFHDAGWFMAFISAPPFMLQALSIAAAVLGEHSPKPVLGRWFGYLNLWIAVLLAPGAVLLFFKSGPLAYHGLLGYWVPLFAFGGWMLAMAWAIRESALAEATLAEAAPATAAA